MLVVLADLGIKDFGTYRKRVLRCQCAGGATLEILANNLGKQERCKPCGVSRVAEANTKHGLSHSRLWNIHHGMLQRCYNPKVVGYHHYGGRGITVCDRWRGAGGFQAFATDMGEPPEGPSLGRRKGHLGYSKKNCRWETRSEQARNTTQNRLITRRGVTKTLVEWSELTKIPESLLRSRLHQGITQDNRLFSAEDLRVTVKRRKDAKGRFK